MNGPVVGYLLYQTPGMALGPMRIGQMCFGFFSVALLLPGQPRVSARQAFVWEVVGCRVQCHWPQWDQVLHGRKSEHGVAVGNARPVWGRSSHAVTSFALTSRHPLGKEAQWQSHDKHRQCDVLTTPTFTRFCFISVPWLNNRGFSPINFNFWKQILYYVALLILSSDSNKIGNLITLTWSMYW